MTSHDLLARVAETNFAYLALGNERFEAHGASFVVNPKTPRRHDANGVGLVRAEGAAVEALLAHVEDVFSDYRHRAWAIDALTPPQTLARIALEAGFRGIETLVHVLEGDLHAAVGLDRAPPSEIEVREVLSEGDWDAYRELDAMWWQETSTGYFGPYDPALHDEFMTYRKLKAPQTRGWFACIEGVPRAFFNSWPGENGAGIIEDLYCHPEFRHRGLATALIARAVTDCRERGAREVIINSDVNDTPKQMYAAMGFRPLYVHRSLTKRLDEPKAPGQGLSQQPGSP